MNELSCYYSALFDEAKAYNKWYDMLNIGVLVIAIISLFSDGVVIAIIGILGLLTHVGLFITKRLSGQSQELAHRLQRISMLQGVFGTDFYSFDISQIKGQVSVSVHEKAKSKYAIRSNESANYNVPETLHGVQKLKGMIQENAYWNHHLYEASSQVSWIRFFAFLATVLIGILFSIVIQANSSPSAVKIVLGLALVFLSFVRIWDELDNALIWQKSSKEMLAIDSSINNLNGSSDKDIMLLFSEYNVTKVKTPPVSDALYNRHAQKLNDGWSSRKQQIYDKPSQ